MTRLGNSDYKKIKVSYKVVKKCYNRLLGNLENYILANFPRYLDQTKDFGHIKVYRFSSCADLNEKLSSLYEYFQQKDLLERNISITLPLSLYEKLLKLQKKCGTSLNEFFTIVSYDVCRRKNAIK